MSKKGPMSVCKGLRSLCRAKTLGWLFLLGVLVVSANPLAAQTPAWLHPVPPGPPYPTPGISSRGFNGTSAVFNPSANIMVVFGGRASTYVNLNDVWVLSGANDTGSTPGWTNPIPNGADGSPAARSGQSAVYDADDDRMIVFGGCGGACTPALNDVWVLSDATGASGTPTWEQLSPTGTAPSPRTDAAAAYDPNTNSLIVFGGQNGGGCVVGCTFSDVWVLSNANGLGATPSWTQLSPSGTPAQGQYGPSAVYDAADNILTVFGGSTGSTGAPTNGVWTLTHANGQGGTPTWKTLIANGAAGSPHARSFQTAVYDASSNRMIIFGGNSTGGLCFNDVWVLSDANGLSGVVHWTQLKPTGLQPAGLFPALRNSHGAVYDPVSNRMIIFGGSNSDDAWMNGIWVLTHANGL
jgi:hypothetical protein